MSGSTLGNRFQIVSFGESHGAGLGVVIQGCPAGVHFSYDLLVRELERRRPGNMNSSTEGIISARNELDKPEVLSGVFEERTLGTPIAILVRNQDARSQDYEQIKSQPRMGHADDVWKNKFLHSDPRGGGRSSGRETVSRVMAGAVAQMVLRHWAPACQVVGFSYQIGGVKLSKAEYDNLQGKYFTPDDFAARFPSERHLDIRELLLQAKIKGLSYGGIAELWIRNCPKYLGQPVFHKLKADLAAAMLSVGATCSFELGDGLNATMQEGSHYHDPNNIEKANYGGIRGGISTGELIKFRVGFKPTSSVLDTATQGRHDPCILIRAIPVLEAMTYITILEHLIWSKTDRI